MILRYEPTSEQTARIWAFNEAPELLQTDNLSKHSIDITSVADWILGAK